MIYSNELLLDCWVVRRVRDFVLVAFDAQLDENPKLEVEVVSWKSFISISLSHSKHNRERRHSRRIQISSFVHIRVEIVIVPDNSVFHLAHLAEPLHKKDFQSDKEQKL